MAELVSADELIQIVQQKFRHLQEALREMRNALPPFGPQQFAKSLEIILEELRDFFSPYIAQSTTQEEEVISLSKIYLKFLHNIHSKTLFYLEHIESHFIPSELFLSFDRLGQQLNLLERQKKYEQQIGRFPPLVVPHTNPPSIPIYFYPTWEFNYELQIENPVEELMDEFPPNIKTKIQRSLNNQKIPYSFLFIFYTRMECRNAFLHPLMIHEIMHAVEAWETIASGLQIEPDKDSLQELVGQQGISERSARDGSIQITQDWVMELICDLLAVRIAGPAYFFASIEQTIFTDTMYRFSETHPALALRLRYLMKELQELGYLDQLIDSEIKMRLREWQSRLMSDEVSRLLEDNARRSDKPYFFVAYNTLKDAFDILHQKVKVIVSLDTDEQEEREFLQAESMEVTESPKIGYSPSTFNSEILDDNGGLLHTLKRGIVRSDVWKEGKNTPISFISLLNAGWTIYLTSAKDEYFSAVGAQSDEKKVEAIDKLHEVILRGIEGSEALRRWQERRGTIS